MADAPEAFDAIIVGGGINGCGTFRDLCAQGCRVLLLERDDFCAGASQGSSRLMHGGLKYLETGEFRLVRESLTERNRLLANAPHLVRPLECLVPVRSWAGGAVPAARRFLRLPARFADRGFAVTALGLTMYDLYGRAFASMPRHRMLTRRRLRRLMPDLDPGIVGAGLYWEARITQAERLGLELVLDGEAMAPGSRAANGAEGAAWRDGALRWREGGRERAATAPVIVNAGGAWIDRVNEGLGVASRHMGGSRGAHLVLDAPRLLAALGGRMVYFGTADGRVNLLYPLEGRVLLGSTDLPQEDPDAAAVTPEEEAYLLGTVAEVFPGIPVRPGEVAYRFTGVRPLPRAEGTTAGLVTRDHVIREDRLPGGPPVLSLVGGKWTTFRAFAEEAADAVLRRLGRPRVRSTADMAIGGGQGFPRDAGGRAALVAALVAEGGVGAARAEALLDRYGTRARGYAAALGGRGETPLASLPDVAREEVEHLAATERPRGPDDVLRRRLPVALAGRASPAARAEVAAILGVRPAIAVG